jgi:hypothetical protein
MVPLAHVTLYERRSTARGVSAMKMNVASSRQKGR